jgi:hypothetical protein
MRYTDNQLIERVETAALGFDGWKVGMYDIWVRSRADVMDAFDDKVYTFEVLRPDERPVFRMVCTGTSHAGSYGLKRFHEYNRLGCAVLKSDVIVYNSHEYGRHKNYIAYRQAKPFPYTRDNDRDDKAENYGQVYWDIIFANCHRAAQKGESTSIYNWSVACLVRNKAFQWYAWMDLMNKRPLSVSILNEF